MAVANIEEYTQKDSSEVLKVILTPQKVFPNGSYFYADAEDIDLVTERNWWLRSLKSGCYVECYYERNTADKRFFHDKLALKKLGHYIDCIDHRNHVAFDNCDSNLFNVTPEENVQNRNMLGYYGKVEPIKQYSYMRWRTYIPQVALENRNKRVECKNEVECCTTRINLERKYWKYGYDFLEDRSHSLDILDLERTGQISADEATYRHVMKYADNAWYYYRFGLEDYFKQNNIPVPQYALDEQGYMVHPITGQRLCPLAK